MALCSVINIDLTYFDLKWIKNSANNAFKFAKITLKIMGTPSRIMSFCSRFFMVILRHTLILIKTKYFCSFIYESCTFGAEAERWIYFPQYMDLTYSNPLLYDFFSLWNTRSTVGWSWKSRQGWTCV